MTLRVVRSLLGCRFRIKSLWRGTRVLNPVLQPLSVAKKFHFITLHIAFNHVSQLFYIQRCNIYLKCIPQTIGNKGPLVHLPSKRDFSLCALIKDRNSLCAPEKIQRSSAPLLQLFRVIHATSVSLSSNAVKLQV